jgi:hypothetical protein
MSPMEIDHENERPYKPKPARRKAVVTTVGMIAAAIAIGTLLGVVFLALLVRLFNVIAG